MKKYQLTYNLKPNGVVVYNVEAIDPRDARTKADRLYFASFSTPPKSVKIRQL